MSGYRLHDRAALLAALVAPFLLDAFPGRPLPSEEARLVAVAPAAPAGAGRRFALGRRQEFRGPRMEPVKVA